MILVVVTESCSEKSESCSDPKFEKYKRGLNNFSKFPEEYLQRIAI